MTPSDSPTSPVSPTSLPNALRVQAAAVAAQQTALADQEARILERRAALVDREQQLTAEFDSKRRQLLELQEQLAAGRAKLRKDRADLAIHTTAETQRVTAVRAEAEQYRDRLREIRAKFIRRFRTRWLAERDAIAGHKAKLAKDSDKLAKERTEFDRMRREFHGTSELEKRRLNDAWKKLAQERARLREEKRRAARAQTMQEQWHARAMQEAAQAAAEREHLEKRNAALRAESAGLENRIANLRTRLAEESARLRPAAPLVIPPPPALEAPLVQRTPADTGARELSLARQASELADQRRHLAELYDHLAQAEADAATRQTQAVNELETLARQLHEHELDLQIARREHADLLAKASHEHDVVVGLRRDTERERAEWAARTVLEHAERSRNQSELQLARTRVSRREQGIDVLFRKIHERRVAEVADHRAALARALQARRAWDSAAAEAHRRAMALAESQQAISQQALALEQARQELLDHADDSATAAKRIERLRRRWEGAGETAKRALGRRQVELERDAKAMDLRFEVMVQREATIAERERDLTSQSDRAAERRRQLDNAAADLEYTRAAWQAERARYEQQLASLRDEVERLARLLFDESPSLPRAA